MKGKAIMARSMKENVTAAKTSTVVIPGSQDKPLKAHTANLEKFREFGRKFAEGTKARLDAQSLFAKLVKDGAEKADDATVEEFAGAWLEGVGSGAAGRTAETVRTVASKFKAFAD